MRFVIRLNICISFRSRGIAELHESAAFPRYAVLHDTSLPRANHTHLLLRICFGKRVILLKRINQSTHFQLRLFIYCLSYVLMIIQHKILTFPFYKYLLWITGSYVDPTNVSMHFISRREHHNAELLTFEIKLHSRLPWSKSMFVAEGKETQLPKPLSIEAFAKFLLKGEMMAFLQNI